MSDREISRRHLLIAGVGTAAVASVPSAISAVSLEGLRKMEPKLVHVPTEDDIKKAFNTAKNGISEATHRAHLTLWQGYANKTNEIRKALAEMEVDPAKANQIYSQMRALKVNYAFAFGGYVNHSVYFGTLGGAGGPATGRVGKLIDDAYGSFDKWVADWKATGVAGRGWAYLAYSPEEQRIFNFIGDSQDSFPAWNHVLVTAMDVYEHAYYLDFQTARAKYIDAWLASVDWDAANERIAMVR
jgi:Fe-Mn family superoxide dismutase